MAPTLSPSSCSLSFFWQPIAVSDIAIYICLIDINMSSISHRYDISFRSKSKEQLNERRAGLSSQCSLINHNKGLCSAVAFLPKLFVRYFLASERIKSTAVKKLKCISVRPRLPLFSSCPDQNIHLQKHLQRIKSRKFLKKIQGQPWIYSSILLDFVF